MSFHIEIGLTLLPSFMFVFRFKVAQREREGEKERESRHILREKGVGGGGVQFDFRAAC